MKKIDKEKTNRELIDDINKELDRLKRDQGINAIEIAIWMNQIYKGQLKPVKESMITQIKDGRHGIKANEKFKKFLEGFNKFIVEPGALESQEFLDARRRYNEKKNGKGENKRGQIDLHHFITKRLQDCRNEDVEISAWGMKCKDILQILKRIFADNELKIKSLQVLIIDFTSEAIEERMIDEKRNPINPDEEDPIIPKVELCDQKGKHRDTHKQWLNFKKKIGDAFDFELKQSQEIPWNFILRINEKLMWSPYDIGKKGKDGPAHYLEDGEYNFNQMIYHFNKAFRKSYAITEETQKRDLFPIKNRDYPKFCV